MPNKWIEYVKQYQKHHGIKTWKQALMEAKPHYWAAKEVALRNGVTSWVPFVAPTPVPDAFDPNTTSEMQQLPEPLTPPTPRRRFTSKIPQPTVYSYRKVSGQQQQPCLTYSKTNVMTRHTQKIIKAPP